MDIDLKKIFGISEAVLMFLLGISGVYLSLSEEYILLMNEKFRWLTFSGSAIIVLISISVLFNPGRRSYSNTIFFTILLILVILGKPHLLGEDTLSEEESSMQAGLWKQIDQIRFPQQELKLLATADAEKIYQDGSSFTTVGIVKRHEALENHNSFALMTTYMYCCLADMIGIGIRVPTDEVENFEDGQWIMISGSLFPETEKIELPNFRFGRATISSTNEKYYLQPEKIMTYSRTDQLSTLSELIQKGERTQLFAKALEESGVMDDLENDKEYTIFLPVDQAIENLETPISEMSRRELKKFVSSHIVEQKISTKELMEIEELETINGEDLKVEFFNAKFQINQSRILFKDTEARNGFIHFIYPAIL